MRLTRWIVWIGIGLLLIALVLIPMRKADASTPIVWVDSAVNTSWPVKAGKDTVDYYTRSMLPFGACRSGYRCIRIREMVVNSSWAAVTYRYSWGSNIYLNPQRRSYSWYAKRQIIAHELAHAAGVTWHTYGCTDIMNSSVFCNGGLPPYRFQTNQIAVLVRY